MTQNVRAIYRDGALRPLRPLDLKEDQVVEIDVRDIPTDSADKEEWLAEFDEWLSGLSRSLPNLSDEQISRESIYKEQIEKQQ